MTYSVLALCGSLRTMSVNNEVLLAMDALSPDNVGFTQYRGLSKLPQFNPDHDVDPAPPSVAEWRSLLLHADAVVICTPEYAHGVPGALKNAFDWVVGSGEMMHKPVAIVSASTSSTFVGPQLTETLTVMMANVVAEANVTLPLAGKKRDSFSMRLDNDIATAMQNVVSVVMRAVDERRAGDAETTAAATTSARLA